MPLSRHFRHFPSTLIALVILSISVPTWTIQAGPTEDALKVGKDAFAAGDKESAITTWINAYNERAVAKNAEDATCAELLQNAAKALTEVGRHPNALDCYEKLYPLRINLNGPKDPKTASVARLLAELLIDTGGDVDRAERLILEAQESLKGTGDEYLADRFAVMLDLAYVKLARKDRLGANKDLAECLEFAKKNPGVPASKIGAAHLLLSEIAAFFGRPADQVRHHRRAVDYTIQEFGKNHSQSYNARARLIGILPAAEASQEWNAFNKELEAVPEDKRNESYYQISGVVKRQLAMNAYQAGNRKGAITWFKAAINHGNKGWGPLSTELIRPYIDMAKLQLMENDFDAGIESYRKVVAIRKAALGENHADTQETQKILDGLIEEVKRLR